MFLSTLIHELSHACVMAQKSPSDTVMIWRTSYGGLAELPELYSGDALHRLSATLAGPVSDFVQRARRYPDNYAELHKVGRFLPHSKFDLEKLEGEDHDDLDAAMVDAILGTRQALDFAKVFPDAFADAAAMLQEIGDGVSIELSAGTIVPLRDLSMMDGMGTEMLEQVEALAGVRH